MNMLTTANTSNTTSDEISYIIEDMFTYHSWTDEQVKKRTDNKGYIKNCRNSYY